MSPKGDQPPDTMEAILRAVSSRLRSASRACRGTVAGQDPSSGVEAITWAEENHWLQLILAL
jgi:hypothetical protein